MTSMSDLKKKSSRVQETGPGSGVMEASYETSLCVSEFGGLSALCWRSDKLQVNDCTTARKFYEGNDIH